jgi:hypothetical protein
MVRVGSASRLTRFILHAIRRAGLTPRSEADRNFSNDRLMQARLLNLDVRLCSIAKLHIQLRPVSLGKDGHRVARKVSYARCCHGDT